MDGLDEISFSEFKSRIHKHGAAGLKAGRSFVVTSDGEYLGAWIRPSVENIKDQSDQLVLLSNVAYVEPEDGDGN